jgi:peptidoglycan/LPS O-acetylase OafA/YrhL
MTKSIVRRDYDSTEGELLRPKMPELDTLRGVAVLLVVFFHAFGFRYGVRGLSGFPKVLVGLTLPGWVGVQLFFVLSGFLITGILLDTKQRTDFYRRFYLRRALRILPLYYTVLALLLVVTRTGLVSRHVSWGFLGLCAVYLANVSELFGVPRQYGPLWSLAVEEHFYLLWPAIVRRLSPKSLAICSLAICALCPVARAVTSMLGYSGGEPYTWLVADSLATGALLASLARGAFSDRHRMWRLSMVSFDVFIMTAIAGAPFGIFLSSTITGIALRQTMLDIFFFSVIAALLVAGTGEHKHWIKVPVLQFFGEISYGLYIVHMLAFEIVDHFLLQTFPALPRVEGHFKMMLLHFVLGMCLAVSVAYFSRRFFEERFLRLKEHFDRREQSAPILQFLPVEEQEHACS